MKNETNLLTIDEIRELPKVELHLHLDCCLSFDAVSKLNPNITQETYNQKFIAPDKCKNLADFLTRTAEPLALMQNPKGLRVAVRDLFEQLKEDNVIYAEIRFAPLQHLEQGMSPEGVVAEVEETVSQCIRDTGVDARIILCSLRHFDKQQSMTTAVLAEDFRGTTVVGIDLAADEAGFPLDAHFETFQYAHNRYIPCTAHAGEARGPESIMETLEYLKPSRIGHGVRSAEDISLVKMLAKEQIHLEICPSCNVQIDVYNSYREHPVDLLFNEGVPLGINTDTRTITNISLSDEYRRLQEVFDWGKGHFLACNDNAVKAAFLPECKKKLLHDKLEQGYNHD